MPPWNTCGDTQGLVRNSFQPSSTECNFMSHLTTELSDAGGPGRPNRQPIPPARIRSSGLVRPPLSHTSTYHVLQLRSNVLIGLPPCELVVLDNDAHHKMLGAHLE